MRQNSVRDDKIIQMNLSSIVYIKTINKINHYWFGFQTGGKCSLSTAQFSGGWKLISIYFLKSSSVL